jgi:hypothetical protein
MTYFSLFVSVVVKRLVSHSLSLGCSLSVLLSQAGHSQDLMGTIPIFSGKGEIFGNNLEYKIFRVVHLTISNPGKSVLCHRRLPKFV